MGFVLATTIGLAGGGAAVAQNAPVCAAPSALTRAGFPLARLGIALAENAPTTILVLNSATAAKNVTPAEKDKVPRSFPSYIEEILHARYPDGAIEVKVNNQPRATAEAILDQLPAILEAAKPALVIWQTGTYDTILGADPSGFGDAVGHGIDMAHAAGSDVIIVSPQYSPRTSFAFDVAPYTNTLRWTARGHDAPFFDRYAIMRFWDAEGIFDFDAARPSPSLFEDVHRCIGRLLVGMISDGVDARTLGSR